jgi:N-acetylmuramoyl-L-alanine amidase
MDSVAGRVNRIVSLSAALACTAAICCGGLSRAVASDDRTVRHVIGAEFPIASDLRLAGDETRTRVVLDLDKNVQFRAFALADPYRLILDLPQLTFQLGGRAGATGRGLIKTFRYGLVMPGGSRIVFDLSGPAKIEKSYVLDAAHGQPPRLVLELEAVDRTTFMQLLRPDLRPAIGTADPVGTTPALVTSAAAAAETTGTTKAAEAADKRAVVVIDPGHGGLDNGTQASGESEKNLVLGFALALRDRIEQAGKYRVVMTRTDDTFVPLGDRVRMARSQSAALFLSIHADALPRREGDAQGATIYTLSEKASDAEAERLAELENKADAIGGVNLTEEPTEVADILIDLAQRETRTFSNRFARLLKNEMKTTARMHKHPLKSAGFRVLKAPDVPSVLLELGYVSNKSDLEHLVSDNWRSRAVGSVAHAIDTFLTRRVVSASPAN